MFKSYLHFFQITRNCSRPNSVTVVFLLCFTLGLTIPVASLAEERRVALVIGNSSYKYLPELENPTQDANAVGQSLSSLGFTVFLTTELDRKKFSKAITFFRTRASTADTVLIYFAGHGATKSGQTFLFPTDFGSGGLFNLEEAVTLDDLLKATQTDLASRLVFIDACRENVVQSQISNAVEALRNQSASTSTIAARPRSGTLITFATTPGHIAYDGTGRHSPFTGALLDHLATPAVDVELMLKRVRRDVVMNSNGLQVPWTESALLTDFYMVPPGVSRVKKPPVLRNRPISSVLSDTGFSQKPILEQIASGLDQTPAKSQPASTAADNINQSQEIRRLLCSIISPPLPADCLTEE